MQLEEYLRALRYCPDEVVDDHLLTAELGVYDNFSILFIFLLPSV